MVLVSSFEDIKGQKAERKKQTNEQTAGGTISISLCQVFSCILETQVLSAHRRDIILLDYLLTTAHFWANSIGSFRMLV